MQSLELKPLKNKHLKLVLVESEFPIEWWLEPSKEQLEELVSLNFVSRDYLKFIENLINSYRPNFAVEIEGLRSIHLPIHNDALANIFREKGIYFTRVDITENALNYLSASLDGKKSLIKKLNAEVDYLLESYEINPNNHHLHRLVMWKEYLEDEYKTEENNIKYKIREAWMVMEILNIARKQLENEIVALFLCDKRHFEGITSLAEQLKIEVEAINIKKVAKNFENYSSISDIVSKSVLEIMPIKVKKKVEEEKILYFFDTDDYASPFDINMAYDAGFNIVIPFCQITSDRIPKLVQDAMFSRKPNAPTVYFVGGSNINESEKVAEEVLKSLVPPFESPVIIDPRGAHTTAAALVAKTIKSANKIWKSELSGKKIVILGGTGPVGQISAILTARLNGKIFITSRREKSAKELAQELSLKAGYGDFEIYGVQANNDDEKFKVTEDADIIWSVGKAGIQMLSNDIMNRILPNKIVADINLVPPYGIEGLKPEHNNQEIYPGIFGIGALNIGRLKYKIESNIFKAATRTKGKKIFDFNSAFEIAEKILFGKKAIKLFH